MDNGWEEAWEEAIEVLCQSFLKGRRQTTEIRYQDSRLVSGQNSVAGIPRIQSRRCTHSTATFEF
jgi:hypothetical protein